MFFGLGQILGPPGGAPRDPDAPQGPRPEVQKGSPVNLMNIVPGGCQGPVGATWGAQHLTQTKKHF